MIKNEVIHPIEISTAMLMDGHVTANQAMVMEALRSACEMVRFIVDGKPLCIMNLAELCLAFNLKYINAHNATNGLMEKGYLIKVHNKFQITDKWYDLLSQYP
jgi:predicted transcriptional regulator